jgi:hypothetical protein
MLRRVAGAGVYVRSTARHAIHLQLDISANAVGIRVLQSPKSIV